MDATINSNTQPDNGVLKKQVLVFLTITFCVTYMMNFIALSLYGPVGAGLSGSKWQYLLTVQMLFPAASAIICLMIFKDKRLMGANKILLIFFMVYFVIALIMMFYNPVIKMPSNNPAYGPYVDVPISQLAVAAFGVPGFILLIVLNARKKSRQQLGTLNLSFGQKKYLYIVFTLLYIILITVGVLLNYAFNLQDPSSKLDLSSFFTLGPLSILNGAIVSWIYFFGEEFGWRGYLQERMSALFGIKKGILLIGIIWGLWHAPIIAMGYNYPGYPVLGVVMMILFCIEAGIIFSYGVFRTKSVWIAALLHLVNNTVLPVSMMYLCKPKDMMFSFGMGVYGIGFIAIFALLVLKLGRWVEE